MCRVLFATVCLGAVLVGAAESVEQVAPLNIKPQDRIAIIGNTLAERMQHDGWLETLVQSRIPDQQIVFRNLGFSADELTVRLRVEGFGLQDEWLLRTRADIVLACFGFNESFAGNDGIDDFKQQLAKFIKHIRSQKYNGTSPPTLVLCSPIAHEDLRNPNLPDGSENNERIKLYTDAMASVASSSRVPFVDLFTPTLDAYRESKTPLTINGIHLNEAGNRMVAGLIVKTLLPRDAAADRDQQQLQRLRQAVQDKNFYWFQRYQPTDGYNVHGGRADLSYNEITNRQVMQREMEVLEAMTANRDKRIWSVAQGTDRKVDDSNTPEFIPVTTNLPGDNSDGSHTFLGGEAAIGKMTVGAGMQVSLFASEEQFPELINPVQMAFDTRGRLFVATWSSYPHWKPKDEMDDKLLILEDTDGDGQADRCTTFAGGLQNPTGFEFWGGGLILAVAPEILFLKDTDGDDVADLRQRTLHGFSSGDTHHAANSFLLGPDGALYFGEGIFHRSQIETPYGPVRNRDGCLWRFEPRTWKLDRYVPYGFSNPHGRVIDDWGQGFSHDGTGAIPFHDTVFSGHLDFPDAHRPAPTLYKRRTRPCSATEILSSRHFPEENQGNMLVANVIGIQGILQYKFRDNESSFTADEVEPIVSSSDHKFRPVDLEIGPDGSLYFTDWQNPIIGHMQHHIRDPNRDQRHGRVYRVTCPDRPLSKPPAIAAAPIDQLLELLKQPELRVRYRTRIELSARDSDAVIAAVELWKSSFEGGDPRHEHHLLESLWIYQQHNVVNQSLLQRMLRSPDYRARAAATRVLCYWRDRVDGSLELMRAQASDEHPRVRLEAVRACSFFRQSEAADVALEILAHPMDDYLQYTLDETLRSLEKFVN